MIKTVIKSYGALFCLLFILNCGKKSTSSDVDPSAALLSEIAALSFVSLPQDLPEFNELAAFSVNAVYYDAGSARLYAGTANGLSISNDKGLSWATRTTRHGLGSNTITAIYAEGSDLSIGTQNGLALSSNGGESFAAAEIDTQGKPLSVNALHFSSGQLYVATENGIAVTADRGSNFTHLGISQGLQGNVKRVYAANGKIFAATDQGFFISDDSGLSFTQKSTADGLQASTVYDILAMGQDIYLGTNEGLALSNNGGVTFRMITTDNGLWNKNVLRVMYNGNQLVVLSAFSDGFQVRSQVQRFDLNGTVIAEIYSSLLNLYTDAFTSGSVLLLGGSTEGMVISEDGGTGWKDLTPLHQPATSLYTTVAVHDGVIYLGTRNGVWLSRDGGLSWKSIITLPSISNIFVNKILVVGRSIYVGASTGFYYSADDGETWTHKTTTDGLPDRNVYDFSLTASALYVVCGNALGSRQGLAVSVDHGNSFTSIKLPALAENKSLTGIHADDSQIYLTSHGGVAVSSDRGETWSDISPRDF